MSAQSEPGDRSAGATSDPFEFDVTRPNAARMYDYFLGGAHNLAIDREWADKTIAIIPQIVETARANRFFLQRAVRYCLSAGLRQFLDLGSGIPTVGHVHEIAHALDPDIRVAYVDVEPVAVAQTRRLLAHVPTATVTRADITDPGTVLTSPGIAGLLDFTEPIALVACAVLHFVPDEQRPAEILAAYRERLAPGSALVFSHGADTMTDPDQVAKLHELYGQTSQPGQRRTRVDIEAMLGGWDLVDPGLVDAGAWHTDNPVESKAAVTVWAAVGLRG